MKKRILGAIGAGVLGAGLIAAPAHAADRTACVYLYINDVHAGTGCFNSAGDHIYAGDYRSDGLRAVTEWYTNYGRSGECHDADGADNGYKDCNYDMDEDGTVYFRIALRNGSDAANSYASPWVHTSIGS